MNKQKTSKAWRWKVATFLPLLALLLMAFGNRSELPIEKNTPKEKFSVHQSRLENDINTATLEIVPTISEKNLIQNTKKKKTETKEQTIQTTEKMVKGKVVDSNDKPLERASVVVAGKTIGTLTDKEGVFYLNLSDTNSIVVSYVGFKSVKFSPDFEQLMNIRLQPDNIGIDNVVVVGYTTRTSNKEKLTIKGVNGDANSNTESKKIFTIVEQMPEFPGGSLALRKYIAQQIKYPAIAQENGIQGDVYVSFVINSYGVVSDAKIARSVDPALDNEAIRVIYSMPKWKPGYQQGKAVDVAFTVPITFLLSYSPPMPLAK